MDPLRLGRATACWQMRPTDGIGRWLRRWSWVVLVWGMASGGALGVRAAEDAEAFDAAARLYEQGKFREAAAAYENLATQGVATVAVLFNQGNAWFRAGEKGRAIASYRRAWVLAPRDPDVTANLNWVRSKVGEMGTVRVDSLDRTLGLLTPNEWAVAAVAGVWVWFGWMLMRELVPRFRGTGASWAWGLAFVAAVLMIAAWTAKSRDQRIAAVVIAPEATVRFGPLEEAQAAFTLTDGAELVVTDRKGVWMEVRDGTGRRGWIANRHLLIVP